MTAQDSSLTKKALTELTAVVLWMSNVLLLAFLSGYQPFLQYFPSLKPYSSFQLFLSSLAAAMGVWELLDLSFGSPFNPVITLTLYIAGKLPLSTAVVMSLSQFCGHLIAVSLVRFITINLFQAPENGIFLPPQPHQDVPFITAILIELIITFVVCIVVLNLDDLFANRAVRFKKWSLMTTLVIFIISIASEWTGSCMNPALSFALSLTEKTWSNHSIYWLGPVLGSSLAGYMYKTKQTSSKKNAMKRILKNNIKFAKVNKSD